MFLLLRPQKQNCTRSVRDSCTRTEEERLKSACYYKKIILRVERQERRFLIIQLHRNKRKCRRNRRSTGARWTPETRPPGVPEVTLAVVITWTRGTWRTTLIYAVTASPRCRVVRDVLPQTRNVLPAMREHTRNAGMPHPHRKNRNTMVPHMRKNCTVDQLSQQTMASIISKLSTRMREWITLHRFRFTRLDYSNILDILYKKKDAGRMQFTQIKTDVQRKRSVHHILDI